MINLRYHIVSLIAVFLALALGVIAGTSVIDQALVKDLERQRNQNRARINDLSGQTEGLRRELDLWERYAQTFAPDLIRGRLRGRKLVLLVEDGVPAELAGEIEDAVVGAGGTRSGRILFPPKWRLDDEPAREQLALALGLTATDPGALLEDASARIAARLRISADPSAESDLLDALRRAGFLTLVEADHPRFPPPDAVIVFVSAGQSPAVPDTGRFTVPLLRALAGAVPVSVTEALGAPASLAERIRGDDDLRDDVASVDHVDTVPGRIALIAALVRLSEREKAPHYGVRRGADAIAPER